MKELKCLGVIALWTLGTIGGIGFALYGDSIPCAAGCAVNAALAWPTVKDSWKKLNDYEKEGLHYENNYG